MAEVCRELRQFPSDIQASAIPFNQLTCSETMTKRVGMDALLETGALSSSVARIPNGFRIDRDEVRELRVAEVAMSASPAK